VIPSATGAHEYEVSVWVLSVEVNKIHNRNESGHREINLHPRSTIIAPSRNSITVRVQEKGNIFASTVGVILFILEFIFYFECQ
jgi:hypothetical protein